MYQELLTRNEGSDEREQTIPQHDATVLTDFCYNWQSQKNCAVSLGHM